MPEILAYSPGLNHTESDFMAGTKIPERPRPTITRETVAIPKLRERPRATVPSAAMRVKKVIVFRGLQESARSPMGICMMGKDKNNLKQAHRGTWR
jgi:hypothetical protein